MRTNTMQLALVIVFLAHQAYLMLDAIARTAHRKLVSRKYLLEWVTAARAERSSRHDLHAFVVFMWPAVAIAFSATIPIIFVRPHALPVAALWVLAWILSPLVAYYVSRRRLEKVYELPARDLRTGRIVARRTWRFFQTFVGDEDHWLPADNVQEEPLAVAHRTGFRRHCTPVPGHQARPPHV